MFNFNEILHKIKFPIFSHTHLFFDLGTTITRIGIENKGVVYREPTYLGYNTKTKEYIFFGKEAKNILGKTPNFLQIIQPVVSGVISDFDAEVSLIKKSMERSVELFFSKYIIKPSFTAYTVIPSIATQIEQKAVEEVLLKAGCSAAYLIEKPLATAEGCGCNIFSHEPNLIVDLGGGLIEIAIVSGEGIVNKKTLKNAGDQMNKLIYNYIYLKYGIILGESTCESLKHNLLHFLKEDKSITIRGKSLESGLPKSVRIKSSDIKEALLTSFNTIVDGIKEIIETSPPETIDELFKRGLILTGGLANIKGIDSFFSSEIKIDVRCIENPADATIQGLMKLGKTINKINKLLIQ
jgi:rod shape-determining protein MreB